jgi:hypothetical protein
MMGLGPTMTCLHLKHLKIEAIHRYLFSHKLTNFVIRLLFFLPLYLRLLIDFHRSIFVTKFFHQFGPFPCLKKIDPLESNLIKLLKWRSQDKETNY